MSKYIATKLHRIIEAEPELKNLADLPHFVIDQRLIDVLNRADIWGSISAVIEAGIGKLPYPDMLIEFEEHGNRRVVYVQETDVN